MHFFGHFINLYSQWGCYKKVLTSTWRLGNLGNCNDDTRLALAFVRYHKYR